MKVENLTLSEIVTAKPEAAQLFENYNLDFCCGGKRKLADALMNDSLKLNEITELLKKLFDKESLPNIDFDNISLSQLIDYIIETHHSYVKENLPVIEQHLEKVATKHGVLFPEIRRIADLFSKVWQDLEQHLIKEERILFPRIKLMEGILTEGTASKEKIFVQSPIDVMEAEHETVHQLLDEIKKLSNHYQAPSNACITFRLSFDELKLFEQDLHQHIHLENNILFPKALKMQEELNNTIYN